jgi:hypothetical protein
MALIDAFSGNAFRMSSLAEAINVVPNTYGRVRELGLFRAKSLPTTTFYIEFKNGVLNLLNTSPRGGNNPTLARTPKRNIRDYRVFHIEHDDFIYADDIQNVRAYGSEFQLQALQELVTESLATLAGKFDITEEWHLVNAIQGLLVDADGTTLFNAFTDFGVSQTSIDFTFATGTPTNDVGQKLVQVVRHIEDNLQGETMTGVHALVGSTWFDRFIAHPSVTQAYQFYASTQEPLRQDVRRRFVHKGVTIEEYRGRATFLNPNDTVTTRAFISDTEARFFPVGTQQAFLNYYGPADFVADANKPGQRLAIKMLPDPSGKDKFIGMHAQMNPFALCTRPATLVRGFSSN